MDKTEPNRKKSKSTNSRWGSWGEVFRHYKRKGWYLAAAANMADEYCKRKKIGKYRNS